MLGVVAGAVGAGAVVPVEEGVAGVVDVSVGVVAGVVGVVVTVTVVETGVAADAPAPEASPTCAAVDSFAAPFLGGGIARGVVSGVEMAGTATPTASSYVGKTGAFGSCLGGAGRIT